ncbi:amino acid permease [Serratia sp. AXJ-M]|uniref:amino acid permease n=1 Tax=Serratia sp. AXJ-M TaxID=2754727 RepID=UPI003979ADCE
MTKSKQHRLKASSTEGPDCAQTLQRGLSERHIQLISIGGAIGTGLFMGSGKTIALSGTSIVLTYVIVGFFMFMVMRAMGELLLTKLDYRSFADFVSEYLGPKASFFLGWSYWLSWVVTCIADVVVCGGYIQYWYPEVSPWLPALLTLGLLCLFNMLSVKMFGEAEFWFAIIKVIAIIALIVTGAWMVFIGWTSPDGVKASVNNITDPAIFMPHGILGFFAGFQIAIFSCTGIELLGTMSAETKDPHKVLPKAINVIPVRIIIFYVFSMLAIIAVTSWSHISPDSSPFVMLFDQAGLPAAAAVINFVALTSAMSSANSGVYSSTRMLYGLSMEKHAHGQFKILSRTTAIPIRSLMFSCFCMVVGTMLLILMPNVMTLFTIVSTVAAILVVYSWGMILAAYLVYRKQRPDLHARSLFKMPGGVIMTWLTLAFFAFTLVLMIFDRDTLIALCSMPLWFITLAIVWRFRIKDSVAQEDYVFYQSRREAE